MGAVVQMTDELNELSERSSVEEQDATADGDCHRDHTLDHTLAHDPTAAMVELNDAAKMATQECGAAPDSGPVTSPAPDEPSCQLILLSPDPEVEHGASRLAHFQRFHGETR